MLAAIEAGTYTPATQDAQAKGARSMFTVWYRWLLVVYGVFVLFGIAFVAPPMITHQYRMR